MTICILDPARVAARGVADFHVGSGGVSGSEGCVSLVAEGDRQAIDRAIALVESVKGAVAPNFCKGICEICVDAPPVQKDAAHSDVEIFCQFQGKKDEALPLYLRGR